MARKVVTVQRCIEAWKTPVEVKYCVIRKGKAIHKSDTMEDAVSWVKRNAKKIR